MTDIELAADGLLTGRVVDRRGHGLSNANVWVLKNDKISSQVVTDREGHFRVLGMTGGVYRLMTSEGAAICRAWNQGTAPPSARRSVLVVSGTQISAGNLASLKYWLADPLVVASITAIAVGVPVIMNNNDRNRKGS